MRLPSRTTPPTDPAPASADLPGGSPPDGSRPAPDGLLSLEARLEAAERLMEVRLAVAAVAYEVNTAHIETERAEGGSVGTAPLDWAGITVPPSAPAGPADVSGPRATPVAALLHRAAERMRDAGWCAGALVDENGALCSQGAIRRESGGDRRLEARAMDLLLEAIRRRFGPSVPSVPAFNDAWADGREPLRMMERASVLADARGI
ncbi:hypothetical protein ACGFS9_08240 [Streptomyces sp. NPDC048566]|uniref:DUF6197 family protein n=1 Tax=Streptomyces sp. NPDC048566 TaxID=3365569 RepID=UPI00371AD57B